MKKKRERENILYNFKNSVSITVFEWFELINHHHHRRIKEIFIKLLDIKSISKRSKLFSFIYEKQKKIQNCITLAIIPCKYHKFNIRASLCIF